MDSGASATVVGRKPLPSVPIPKRPRIIVTELRVDDMLDAAKKNAPPKAAIPGRRRSVAVENATGYWLKKNPSTSGFPSPPGPQLTLPDSGPKSDSFQRDPSTASLASELSKLERRIPSPPETRSPPPKSGYGGHASKIRAGGFVVRAATRRPRAQWPVSGVGKKPPS